MNWSFIFFKEYLNLIYKILFFNKKVLPKVEHWLQTLRNIYCIM